MNKEDKDIFKLMDEIPYEEQLELLDNININEITLETRQRERIKSCVMSKLTNKTAFKRNKIKAGIIAAGITLSLIVTGLTPFGQKVAADIAEKLFFIPGLGKVEVSKGNDIFILAQPVEYKNKGAKFTVSSVTKNGNALEIFMSGEGSGIGTELTIEDESGKRYNSSSYCTGFGISWTGVYYFYDIPSNVSSFKILYLSEAIIPITLKKADSYEDYTSMGPTDEKNNFSITLVPRKFDNKVWFDLIQQPSQDKQVSQYGKDDTEGHSHFNIHVKDNNGNTYEVEHLQNMGTTSSFYFVPKGTAEKYTVQIPEITLKYKVDNEISLPMPKDGETLLNKDIPMHGFNLRVNKILREGNKVKLFVDTGYDENKPENMSIVHIDSIGSSPRGYSWHYDEHLANQLYEFDINPDDKKLKIKFRDMYTIMKGPWTFEINNK